MKYYNVCYFNSDGSRYWTHWNDMFGYSYGSKIPKRLTLEEANKFRDDIVYGTLSVIKAPISDNEAKRYVVLEMNSGGNPIIPECRRK